MTKHLYQLNHYFKSQNYFSFIKVVILNFYVYKWISNIFKIFIIKIKIIIKLEFEECPNIIRIANLQLT